MQTLLQRSDASGSSTPPLEMKLGKTEEEPTVNGDSEKEKEDETPSVDIMAQQLKFVACLKILMEELSTLATGFEVDGKCFSNNINMMIAINPKHIYCNLKQLWCSIC